MLFTSKHSLSTIKASPTYSTENKRIKPLHRTKISWDDYCWKVCTGKNKLLTSAKKYRKQLVFLELPNRKFKANFNTYSTSNDQIYHLLTIVF